MKEERKVVEGVMPLLVLLSLKPQMKKLVKFGTSYVSLLVGKSFFRHENCFKRICLLKLGWWAYQRVLQETWNHVNFWKKREAQQSWYIGKVPVSLNKGVHRYQEMHGKMQVMGEIGRGTFFKNQKICFNTQCQR